MRVTGWVWLGLAGCVEGVEPTAASIEQGADPSELGAAWPEPEAAPLDELPGGAATKSHPDCGDTITRDTRLRHDIGPCQGDGIVIADDDVELDCDGHRILGSGGGVGVLAQGVDDAEVENCRIQDFDEGIHFEDVDGGEIEDNELSAGGGTPPFPFSSCVFIQDSEDLDVDDNHARGCRGFYITGATEDLVVEDNEVEDGEIGFMVVFGVVDSRFEDNRVRGGSGAGFELDGIDDNEFEDNDVKDGASGFLIDDCLDNRFEGNEASRNDNFGFFLLDAHENEFEDNEANDNGTNGFQLSGSDDNDFEDNEACDNGDVDLFVDADSHGNDFDDNDFCETQKE